MELHRLQSLQDLSLEGIDLGGLLQALVDLQLRHGLVASASELVGLEDSLAAVAVPGDVFSLHRLRGTVNGNSLPSVHRVRQCFVATVVDQRVIVFLLDVGNGRQLHPAFPVVAFQVCISDLGEGVQIVVAELHHGRMASEVGVLFSLQHE